MLGGVGTQVAEDEPLVAEMVCGIIQEIGCTVVGVARNGAEALKMAAALHPDVVIMDLEMPEMDGAEATRRLQEESPIPVVALTAHETEEWVCRATEAGVGAYLTKPTTPRETERAIAIANARFQDMSRLRALTAELREALERVRTLRGLLPICAACKRVRDSEGTWQQVEVYVRDRSEAEFSHGLCPQCAAASFGLLMDETLP